MTKLKNEIIYNKTTRKTQIVQAAEFKFLTDLFQKFLK